MLTLMRIRILNLLILWLERSIFLRPVLPRQSWPPLNSTSNPTLHIPSPAFKRLNDTSSATLRNISFPKEPWERNEDMFDIRNNLFFTHSFSSGYWLFFWPLQRILNVPNFSVLWDFCFYWFVNSCSETCLEASSFVVATKMLQFSFLPSKRWSGRQKLKIPRFVCEKTFYKIGYAGFFPFFFFFPFFLFLITELRKQRRGSPILSRKPKVWNSKRDVNLISFPHIHFPFPYSKYVWRQVLCFRLNFLLHARAWWPNDSFRRDLSSSVG